MCYLHGYLHVGGVVLLSVIPRSAQILSKENRKPFKSLFFFSKLNHSSSAFLGNWVSVLFKSLSLQCPTVPAASWKTTKGLKHQENCGVELAPNLYFQVRSTRSVKCFSECLPAWRMGLCVTLSCVPTGSSDSRNVSPGPLSPRTSRPPTDTFC